MIKPNVSGKRGRQRVLCVWGPQRPEEGVSSLGIGVTVMSHHVDAGHQTPVFCKSSQFS